MSKFVLTAQLQLQAPRNTNQVLNQMRQQLSGLTIPVDVKGAAQAQKQIKNVANETQRAASAAESMGRSFGLATKRFAAFTVASRAVSLLTNSLANSIQEAVDFQREMIKISQVSGKTMAQLKGLQQTITNLASSLGTSSTDLLKVTRVLAQAGVQAQDLEVALAALAKTTLAATFDNIENTAEGAVAILRQFGEGVGALERQLGAINAVAGQFAVESGDLIGAVRRFGGVFKSAGGSLEELLAIFTSVRATTRESAESISTGLRTIFTRIQRPKTIAFLEQLGIQLTNAEGKFVGPMEAARKLSEALSGLAEGDLRFVQIAEELGGFRQIGKVIPLLQQFETAQQAYNAAKEGGNSLDKDAATAQQALSVQIAKVREEFQGLVRSITDSSSFQLFVRTSLELASALIKVGEALTPLIPLMATFGSISLARGIGGFLAGAGAGLRGKNQGGRIYGFARGGLVPGTGNRDTVPAMLSPGEFVIRQSSVKKMGAASLQAMNENRFKNGTKKRGVPSQEAQARFNPIDNAYGGFFTEVGKDQSKKGTGGEFVLKNKSLIRRLGGKGSTMPARLGDAQYSLFTPSTKDLKAGSFKETIMNRLSGPLAGAAQGVVEQMGKEGLFDFDPAIKTNRKLLKVAKDQISNDKAFKNSAAGYLFESIITAFTGAKASGSNTAFDFNHKQISKNRDRLGAMFGSEALIAKLTKGDAKSKQGKHFRLDQQGSLPAKVVSDIQKGKVRGLQISSTDAGFADTMLGKATSNKKKAAGGGIGGTDNVPALLTPGEFVINRGAAQSIGYGNLNRMNRSGVSRFAKGGTVGVQKFAEGGGVMGMGGGLMAFSMIVPALQMAIEKFGDKSEEASDAMAKTTIVAENMVQAGTQIAVGGYLFHKMGKGFKTLGDSLDNWSKGKGFRTTEDRDKEAKEKWEARAKEKERKSAEAAELANPEGITAGEISQATFSIGSAVINVQSTQEAAGDAGRAERSFGPDAQAGIVATTTTEGIREARAGRESLIQERANLVGNQNLTRGSISEGGAIATRLSTATANENEIRRKIKEATTKRNTASGVRKDGSTDASMYDPEKVAQWNAKLEALQSQLGTVTQETMDAQASFDLAAREISAMDDALREYDVQIDASNKSTQEAIATLREERAARVKEAAEKKAAAAERKAAAKKAKESMGWVEKKFKALSIQAKRAGLRVKGFGRDSKKHISVRLRAASIQMKRFGLRLKRLDRVKRVSNYMRGMAINAKRLGLRLKVVKREMSFVLKPAKMAGQAIKSLGQRIRGLGGAAGGAMKRMGKRGAGLAGRGLKAGAGGFAAAGMIVNTAAAIGSAITGAISQMASRDKEKAIKAENVGGAAQAAGREALASGMGEMFSIGGFFEAVSDPQGFVDRRFERKESAEASTATQVAVAASQRVVQDISKEGSDRFRQADGALDMGAMGSMLGNDARQARMEIGDVKDPAERAKLESQLDAQMRASITSIASKNISEAEAIQLAEDLAGHNSELKEQYIALAKSTVALREAQAALSKANFDSLKITSAFSGAKTAVDGFIAGLTTGASELGGFIGQLENAQKTIGVDATAAIDKMEESLLASADAAGANPALKSAISGQADVARAANQFQKDIGAKVTEGTFSRSDAGKAKVQLRKQLMDAIPKNASPEAQKKMRNAIEGRLAGITQENVATTDISDLLQGISEDASQLGKGFLEAAKLQDGHNKQMTALYKQREQLELAAAQALNKAIDIQLEAAKIFEDFGGKALTTEQKTDARVAQFNNVGKMAGVSLAGGGAGDIRRAGEQLNNIVTNQNRQFQTDVMGRGVTGSRAGAGMFAGAQGVQDDRRDEAKRANESLIQFTKQRITLLKEELAIVQKKNAEEKSSLEKLLSGDIEGFISGQAAAGAGAALRTGDAGLAGLFGASALGAGFKGLEGQGLSDQEMQRAAGLSLGAVGINDTRSAQILAGTTTEEEAIKSEGRELAGVMGDLAQQQAQFAEAEIEIQEAVINAANLTFNRELKEISDRNQGFARGGMVYASRGMFVPRGTDTVPAMLTPGEFVVNRAAVQRGNNIQILRAMNGRGGAGSPAAMSGGGAVRYYQTGDLVEGGAGALSSVIPNLQAVFSDFAATVDKLVKTKFHVSLDPTNVNVNFNGASFLETMKEDIKKELLDEVGEQIKKSKPNTSGDLKTGTTVLGN